MSTRKIDRRRTTNVNWRAVTCRKCGANPDERCRRESGKGTDPHAVRIDDAANHVAVPVFKVNGLTPSDADDYENRLRKAATALDAMRSLTSSYDEHERLRAKSDGLKVALSYFREYRQP